MAKATTDSRGKRVYALDPIPGRIGTRGAVLLRNGTTYIKDYKYLTTMYKLFETSIHNFAPSPFSSSCFKSYNGQCNERFKGLAGIVFRYQVYRTEAYPGGQYDLRYTVKSITGDPKPWTPVSPEDSLVILSPDEVDVVMNAAWDLHWRYIHGEFGFRDRGELCTILTIYTDWSYSLYPGKDAVAIGNFRRLHGMVPMQKPNSSTENSSVAAYRSAPLPVKKSFVRSEDGFLVIR